MLKAYEILKQQEISKAQQAKTKEAEYMAQSNLYAKVVPL